MDLKFYNTLTRKKETFRSISEGKVTMYNCGPTVYWYQHIGNLKAYLFADLLRRILEFNGYNVKQVINVTDVGHLKATDDFGADEGGEDKMEIAAKREGKTARDISLYYYTSFKQDLEKLNIQMPSIWSWATEHISEQINLIRILEDKGFTYQTSDGIYFNSLKFEDYGRLGKLDLDGLEAGKRINMSEKKNKTDFALWKFSDPSEKRQQEWDSPWGRGFPGWHIECSAMAMKHLGDTIDIHTGGIDHIPVHHTNEIAQSEAATGKKFVNYWLHENFLTFKGEKVSKSKGGLFTLTDLENKGFSPMSYRYYNLTAIYRKPMDFSIEILENAQNSYRRLKNIILSIKDDGKENEEYLRKFRNAINDDLNMPKALAVLWDLVRDEGIRGKYRTIQKIDEILALDLLKKIEPDIPEEVRKIAEERANARTNKDWEKSDKLRDELKNIGWNIKDEKEGWTLEKI